MEIKKEQVEKAMQCKTVEELLELAKAEGFELSREEAEEFIARMKTRELTKEELEKVAGGQLRDFRCLELDVFCPCVYATCPFCKYCGHCYPYDDETNECIILR